MGTGYKQIIAYFKFIKEVKEYMKSKNMMHYTAMISMDY